MTIIYWSLGGWLARAAAPTPNSLRFVPKGQYCHSQFSFRSFKNFDCDKIVEDLSAAPFHNPDDMLYVFEFTIQYIFSMNTRFSSMPM